MSTRTKIVMLGGGATVAAAWANQPTIAAIALATTAVVYLLHAIEVKLNRLLDDRNILVSDRDIDRD